MFDLTDIRAVQKERPDLTDSQAEDVLGFLVDVFNTGVSPCNASPKLFKETADYIYPKLLVSA